MITPLALEGTTLDVLLAVLPGLLVAAAAVLVFWLGARFGRSRRPEGESLVADALRRLAAGHYDVEVAAEGDAAATALPRAVNDLARTLRDRHHKAERRLLRLGEASEAVPGRALLVTDASLVVTTASESAAQLAGTHPGDLEGRGLDALFAGDSFRDFVAELTLARRRRESVIGNLTLAASPAPIPVKVTASWWQRDGDGLALFMDDAREEGEPAADALARYRGIVEGMASGLLVIVDGRISEANPAATALLGDAVVGKRLKDLVAAEDLLLVLDRVARASHGESVDPFRARIVPADAALETRVYDAEARALRTSCGIAVAVALRDGHDENQAVHRLSAHQGRLNLVLDGMSDGVALLSAPAESQGAWRVALMNRTLAGIFDLEPTHSLGTSEDHLRALVAHRFADPTALVAFLEEASHAPAREHAQIFDLAPGLSRTVELVMRPLDARGGAVEARLLVVRDITRHRAAERRLAADATQLDRSREELQRAYEELMTLHRDLANKSDELDHVNAELQGLDKMRSRLLSDVAHELNSPLTSIRGYVQMISDGRLGKLNDEQRRALSACLRNVDHMSEMVGNVLALARAEEGGKARSGPVDAIAAIKDVLSHHEGAARAREIVLEGRVETEDAVVEADRGAFVQVLDNLVGNAVKFTPRRGFVHLRVGDGPNGYVEVEVEDNGIGIPAEERDKIWERFYRGRGAIDSPGSGIGLSTVKALADAHGAKVSCESREGEGSRFRVLWPRARANEGTEAGSRARAS